MLFVLTEKEGKMGGRVVKKKRMTEEMKKARKDRRQEGK
jgi:hypothetical protein